MQRRDINVPTHRLRPANIPRPWKWPGPAAPSISAGRSALLPMAAYRRMLGRNVRWRGGICRRYCALPVWRSRIWRRSPRSCATQPILPKCVPAVRQCSAHIGRPARLSLAVLAIQPGRSRWRAPQSAESNRRTVTEAGKLLSVDSDVLRLPPRCTFDSRGSSGAGLGTFL